MSFTADDGFSVLADIVRDLNRDAGIGMEAARMLIEEQLHGAAYRLLESLLPPIVHGQNVALRGELWAAIESSAAEVSIRLSSLEVNQALQGNVADAVETGIDRLTTNNDYAQGVNSIG